MTSDGNLNIQGELRGSDAAGGGKMWQRKQESGGHVKKVITGFAEENQNRDHRWRGKCGTTRIKKGS